MGIRNPRTGTKAALLPAAALAACALLCAAPAAGRRAGGPRPSAADAQAGSPAAPARGLKRTASHGGVTFTYDASLASAVKGEDAPAGVCGKPGDVMPPHVAFTFADYPKPHASPFMSPPEIQVFPVAEYRRALAECQKERAAKSRPPSPIYLSDFDDGVRTLKSLNAARPAPRSLRAWLRKHRGRDYLKTRMPFVPMYDVGEMFRARVTYLDFRGGRGVAFVTQYVNEDTTASNQALTYVFQGLTDDGRFYVSAAFPVAAPFLPADFSEEEAATHGLDYREGMFTPAFRRNHAAHKARTARRLEALAPSDYRPGLGPLGELLRSLDVRPESANSSTGVR